MTRPTTSLLRTLAISGSLTLAAGLVLLSVSAIQPAPDDHEICHATGSASNPYVLLSPDKEGVHDGHLGESHQDGDDIVPPFTHHDEVHSQNWDAEGQAIFENGCDTPSSTTTTTTGSQTTTTSPPSETTTTTSDTNTTTTQIPVFGSGTAVALGIGGSVLGSLLMLRRRL